MNDNDMIDNDVFLDYTAYHDKFAAAELEMLKENFSFFDKDGNGTISVDDLSLVMRACGML